MLLGLTLIDYAATVGGEQIRAGNGPAPPPSNASIISGEHIDTSNMKGVPVDPTTTSIAGMLLCVLHVLSQ